MFYGAKIPIFSKWERYFWQIYERFASFSSTQKKFSLFLPLPFREKSERPEKAHSSLYSSVMNLDNSCKKEGKGKMIAFIVMFVYPYTDINSGAIPYPLFLFLRESRPNYQK